MDSEQKYHTLLRALREGNRLEVALLAAGLNMIEYRALRTVPEIDEQIRLAMVEKERAILNSLTQAALDGNTDAARWFLERKSDAYMTVAQRKTQKLAEDRWRMEKKIINAELNADPNRVAANAHKMLTGRKKASKPKAHEESFLEAEVIATSSPSETDQT